MSKRGVGVQGASCGSATEHEPEEMTTLTVQLRASRSPQRHQWASTGPDVLLRKMVLMAAWKKGGTGSQAESGGIYLNPQNSGG